jgi:uncharacterized caspase-like protein
MMNLSGSLKLHRLFLAILLLLAVCRPALAEKRVALVIGNSAYQNVAGLPNPVNDGAVMAATLKDAGFDVVDSRHDLSALEMRRALRDFADRARDADIAVVYYAGHGMELDGTNYLIPVDAKLERDTDVYDEAFSLDRILLAVEPAKQLRLVILDACRDNPFAKIMKKTLATRSIGRGLAKVEPTSPNTLIAYAAKAGSTAQDGDTKNSPFTIALAKHLTTPGLDVRRAFGFVRDDVMKDTSNRQEPFVYGSLGGDDVPLVPARSIQAPSTSAPSAAAPNPQGEVRRDYELALQLGNKAAMNVFLTQHPDGFYASLAKLQLEKFTTEEAHRAATEKAQLAEQERTRLAAEGAQKALQAKADADARAAERARIAAEQAQQVAQRQAADAERKRTDKVADNAAAAATPAPAADKAVNLAALTPAPAQPDVTKSVQSELRRVGCLNGAADGEWNSASQRSLAQFNRYAGMKLDVKVAGTDALDAIKLKPSRVCPLVCEHGFKADGERCSKIVCADGTYLNDDNECVKQRGKATVKRDDDDRSSRSSRQGRQDNAGRPVAPRGGAGYGYDAGVGALPPRLGRSQPPISGPTAASRPLTGDERLRGCNSNQAIMSGICPP